MVLPDLNTVKIHVKKYFKKGLIIFGILLMILVLMRMLTSLKNSIFPDASSLPQAAFGKLPAPFQNNSGEANFTFSVDTISGLLPNFQTITKVYKIMPVKPDLLAVKKTQEKVRGAGFTKEGAPLSEDSYQWVEQNPAKIITMNILTYDFVFFTPYLTTQSIQTFDNLNQVQMAIGNAESFLSSMFLFPQDLDEKKTKTTNYSILNNTLVPATSISNTNIVRVDFFQEDIDNLPIFYENESNINLLVGKEQNQLRVVEAHYSYKTISEESSTYAIKTTSEAFLDLKQGKGFISQRPQNINNMAIKNVFLGYYMKEKRSDFLLPVIVFQGDNFIVYVSAVKDEWINN